MVYDSDGKLVKAGDVLSFHRGLYSHIALAVDSDNAVHLTGDNIDFDADVLIGSSVGGTYAEVKLESIEKIAGKDKFYVMNDVWKTSTKSREEVVCEAQKCVGQKRRYNVVTCNCEHFVNELITGKASSQQVSNAVALTATGLLGAGLFGGMALLIGSVLFKRDKREVVA